MAYFPIFIEIEKQKCLVIGGGKVALRKIETLLRYGAQVQVISREVCEEISGLLSPECIRLGEPEEADMSGAVLVIAATGSRQVNHRAAVYCRENGIPVNVADAPEECSFFFPAVVKKGDISVGINTGGKSPSVSSQVRRDIEKAVPDYYGDIAEQLGRLREYVKSHVEPEYDRRAILKQAAAAAFRQERTLSQNEINTMIRQVLNHGTVSGGPVGY
mgnify:CR=1 FL=1